MSSVTPVPSLVNNNNATNIPAVNPGLRPESSNDDNALLQPSENPSSGANTVLLSQSRLYIITALLSQSSLYITPELDEAFGVSAIQEHYERIAHDMSRIQTGNNKNSPKELEKLVGEIIFGVNFKLEFLGNPTQIKGYSELCDLYRQLNSYYEKELVNLQALSTLSASDTKPTKPVEKNSREVLLKAISGPCTTTADENNAIAVSEAKKLAEGDKIVPNILAIDTVMRKSLGLVIEIIDMQLEIVQSLLAKQPGDRNFDAVPRQLAEKMLQVRKGQFYDYCSLLDQRETIFEDGHEVPLTVQEREVLKRAWLESIDQVLQIAKGDFNITSDTDLNMLRLQLEEMKSTKFEAYAEMMEGKTLLTNRLFKIQHDAHQISLKRAQLLDPEAVDIWNASASGNLQILQQCIQKFWFWNQRKGINALNENGYAPIHLAVFNDQIESVKLLLQNYGDPSLVDKDGYQPLHWAAKRASVIVAEELLAQKVNINARGEYGRTPLHMAVFNNRLEMANCLLGPRAERAQINAQTDPEDGSKTPLHDAVIHGDLKLVTCLVKHKELDVMICNRMKLTPFSIAVMDGQVEIASLILGHQSWKPVIDLENPNHRNNLLKLKIHHNEAAMKEFLKTMSD